MAEETGVGFRASRRHDGYRRHLTVVDDLDADVVIKLVLADSDRGDFLLRTDDGRVTDLDYGNMEKDFQYTG